MKETRDFGILYSKDYKDEKLVGYSDADYVNDRETRCSTTGYVFLMCGGPITWACQRQKSASLSTTEAEYVAASNATREAVWLKQLLTEIGEEQTNGTTLYIDNQSTIKIQIPVFHKRSKHIDVAYHFVREKYKNNVINVKYIPTTEQLADISQKLCPKLLFIIFALFST